MSMETVYRNSIYQPRWGNIEFVKWAVNDESIDFSDVNLFNLLKSSFFLGKLETPDPTTEYYQSTFGNYLIESISFDSFKPITQDELFSLLIKISTRNFYDSYGFSDDYKKHFENLIVSAGKLFTEEESRIYYLVGDNLRTVFPEGGLFKYFDFFFITGVLSLVGQEYTTIATIRVEKE
jgi:hypothetical protein